jgi:hypothetical protein
MSKQNCLTSKVGASLIVIFALSACGSSSNGADSKNRSDDQTCETVNTIRNDIEQNKIDLANGELDFGEALVEFGTIQARIEIVQESAPEGDLKVAVDRWASSRQRIFDDTGENAQLTEENETENDAAADALDKMCK